MTTPTYVEPFTRRIKLPRELDFRQLRQLVEEVNRCKTWSTHAAMDVDRLQHFGARPVWCLDFSEVHEFVTQSTKQPAVQHVVATLLERPDEQIVLLPGALFEIMVYLERLLLRRGLRRLMMGTGDLREMFRSATSPTEALEKLVGFVTSRAKHDLEAIVDELRTSDPTVMRLGLLLDAPNTHFFHNLFRAHDLFAFPGYFERIERALGNMRDTKTLNNHNDALNITTCYAANTNGLSGGDKHLVYVTRDRACMRAATLHPWDSDPIQDLYPGVPTPLCRDPYAVLLFLGDIRTEHRIADSLSFQCARFVSAISRTKEYRTGAVRARNEEMTGRGGRISIRFRADKDVAHKLVEESLTALLAQHGELVYRAIEDADWLRNTVHDTVLGLPPLPKSPVVSATRSLEQLTATFGYVYHQLVREAVNAQSMVDRLEHLEGGAKLQVRTTHDAEFESVAAVIVSTVGRRSVVCTVERYADYFSVWWNSSVGFTAFLDLVDFFWGRAHQLPQELPDDSDKVFATGFSLVTSEVIDGSETITTRTKSVPDLMPLDAESRRMLLEQVAASNIFSIRLNSRAGDFWINLRAVDRGASRMGMISHLWDPKVLARIVASSNLHYCGSKDLEAIFKELSGDV